MKIMQRIYSSTPIAIISFLVVWFMAPAPAKSSEQLLRFSCSEQIDEAFMDAADSFSSKTGIKVNKYSTSSRAAVYRLMNGMSDLAGTTHPLSFEQKDMGYVEIAFCKDPLSIIVNSKNGVKDMAENQLTDIFTGKITNWKHLGGQDHPIVIIIPEKDSGVFYAFDYSIMKGKTIKYDVIAKTSTMVVDLVKNMEWAISVVSQGASVGDNGIHAVKIDGLTPKNDCYPYYQVFLFVTKGKPAGPAKEFIDFAYSDAGKEIIKMRGMIPISNEAYLETLKTCSEVSFGR
ncbi:putative ABC-type phosphate transport system periplasmic component PstS [uncultured Desulfobacterium sp.]|uniref:Putative ABC-type phosphate transport system periplasmic component PstS n=1 Tax=uncultured Desulfobacterium sp. TaxID=201089 RepID=A0A445MUQ3_9BACT|nr:putative ABC-type phosphate transport system periplasmic component PstS [uncultured Desulfobacterium sp.]